MSAETISNPIPVPEIAYIGAHRAAEEAAHSTLRTRMALMAGRAVLAIGLAAGLVSAEAAANPAPAEAHAGKTIGACRGPFWGLSQQTCVTGVMGEKDYARHREWVGNVDVKSPNAGPGFLEIWGDGFYKSRDNATEANWDINKFVASGTNICGAGTDKDGFREIVCFKISV